jgi:tetratricopeptide (TPR) repeat protein
VTAGAVTRAPYVGPQPFDRKDARLFFGREAEVRMLLSYIVANRVVLLYAPSGAGKTSLLNAGVIPLLEHDEDFEVLPPARVRGFAADDAPPSDVGNVYVYNALVHWTGEAAAKSRLTVGAEKADERRRKDADRRVSPAMTLKEFLESRATRTDRPDRPTPRAVVFDQFEELFTAYPEFWEQRVQFFRQVGEALEADSYLRVVLALREDHLAELLSFVDARPPMFPEPVRFRLERLGRDAALEAITRPLEGTGRAFAPDVAKRLVDDLLTSRVDTEAPVRGEFLGQFVEPMHLQLAGQSLWAGLAEDASEITHRDLRKFGDVDQVLSNFYADAVAAAAEQSGIEESTIRVWVDQSLITEMDTRHTVYRARDTTAGIPNKVIDVLERKGLIRRDPRAGADWYELTHDRFIKPIRAANREAQAQSLGWIEERGRSQPAEQALARASDASLKGRFDEALAAEEEALRLYEEIGDDRGMLNALVEAAGSAYRLGRYEDSLGYLMRAREVADRTHDTLGAAEVARGAGYSLYALERIAEAIAAERTASELFAAGGDASAALYALIDIGQMCWFSGNPEEANKTLAAAAERSRGIGDPYERAGFLRALADAFSSQSDAEGLVWAYRTSFAIYAQLGATEEAVSALVALAEFQSEHEDYEGAVESYTRALELSPDDAYLCHRRGVASWYHARYSDAVDDLSKSLQAFGDWPEGYSARGQAFAEWGKFEPAVADLGRAIALGDEHTVAYAKNGLGLALGGLGEFDQALAAFKESLVLEPHNAWAYFNRAVTYERMGERGKAERDYTRALKEDGPALNRWRREQALAYLGKD